MFVNWKSYSKYGEISKQKHEHHCAIDTCDIGVLHWSYMRSFLIFVQSVIPFVPLQSVRSS